MKESKDKFSIQAKLYKQYRPNYPKELYEEILKATKVRNTCWDCGTGNGQVAIELAKYFKKVCATDISEKQISHADRRENIIYQVERAEKTSFANNQFDLITVGQAVHWFDFDEFNNEAKRVLKPDGIISIWGYGLLRIEEPIDNLIDKFYNEIVGLYWDSERIHIDKEYSTVKFDFKEIIIEKELSIQTFWTLEELIGYLNSWSSVQNYMNENGKNPVDFIIHELGELWERQSKRQVVFPIFMKIGKTV